MALLYGSQYWKEIINFDALVRHGMISPKISNCSSSPTIQHSAWAAAKGSQCAARGNAAGLRAFVHASASTPKRAEHPDVWESKPRPARVKFRG